MHQLLPIGAVGQPITPGYCERLKARQSSLELGKEALVENIQRLDRCIEEFSAKIQIVMNRLSEYWMEQNALLLKIREELIFAITEAIQEAEASLYQDTPKLRSSLAGALREAEQERGPLQLFEYSIDESTYPASLDSLLVLKNGLVRTDSSVLPIIMSNQLILFNLREGSKQVEITHPTLSFNDEASICQITPQQYLIVHQHNVFLLDLESKRVMLKQHTIRSRVWAGVIRHGCFVYVFGGRGEKSAEKYDLALNKWIQLPEMHQDRSKFSPALYKESVYLIDTCGRIESTCVCQLCHEESGFTQAQLPRVNFGPPLPGGNLYPPGGPPQQGPAQRQSQTFSCEVFAIPTQQFTLLNVLLPRTGLATWSVAFVREEQLFVFAETGDWYSWRIGSEETVFSVPLVRIQDSAFRTTKGGYDSYRPVVAATSPPVAYGGRLYWLNHTIGQITSYDARTLEVAYKAL